MFKNILLPTKGSEGCNEAVKAGMKLAKTVGAKVTIVTVPPRLGVFEILETYRPDQKFISTSSDVKEAKESMEKVEALQKVAGQHFVDNLKNLADEAGVQAETRVMERMGVEDGIFKAAQESGADLILMAAQSDKGMLSGVLGSVTNKIVTNAKIPVLVYRCS
ncbi:MAG: universal stress protein [Proteobacteria bacterium]|nr:universal stress protein [Pseudomonadota bacterium]